VVARAATNTETFRIQIGHLGMPNVSVDLGEGPSCVQERG